MRVLDLERALSGAGAPAENLKNEAGAIEHLGAPGLFQIALLHRRERAVHHDNAGLVGFDEPGNLFDLAGAEIRRRPQRAEHDDAGLCDIEIDGARKADGLIEARRRRPVGWRRARSRAPHHGLDHERAAGCRAGKTPTLPSPARGEDKVGARVSRRRGSNQTFSPAGASSAPSKSWTG